MARRGQQQETSSPLFQIVLFVCGVGFLASILLAVGILKIDFVETSVPSSTVNQFPKTTTTSTASIDVAAEPIKGKKPKNVPKKSSKQQKHDKHTLFDPFQNQKSHLSKKDSIVDLHFIHIPKCGGTSMTAVLRQVACELNKDKNVDCCTNQGFCDWHAHRRCSAIKGCTDHFPQR